MSELETNVFLIDGLDKLSAQFQLYKVLGLNKDSDEYFQDVQNLHQLSFSLRKPVAVLERGGDVQIAVPVETTDLPSQYQLVRKVVSFEPEGASISLDFGNVAPEHVPLALRYLRFAIQQPLRFRPSIWQTASGHPFYLREPAREFNGVNQFLGFKVRPFVIEGNTLGVCVDATSRYVEARPLPNKLSRDSFARQWKGRKAIYHFGDLWYEIHMSGLADQCVCDYSFVLDGKSCRLIDYILDQTRKPVPQEIVDLPDNGAVILYRDNRQVEKAAPAGLCYRVCETLDRRVRSEHNRTILPPHIRRARIKEFVEKHLCNLTVGGARISVQPAAYTTQRKTFVVPDLRFGGDKVLSVRGTQHAEIVSLGELGRARASLLRSPSAGFYQKDQLDGCQYLLMPRSVCDSFGDAFREGLVSAVTELFPQEVAYDPVVVSYDDHGKRTFVEQGRAIIEAASKHCKNAGYAVVMIHDAEDRRRRQEDQLAALAVRELRKLDVYAATIHSATGKACYRETRGANGERQYVCNPDRRGKMQGYLQNVALTKVLLTNSRWPFVLASPLHADITVGIDVKNNVCGFLSVNGTGTEIIFDSHSVRQPERLSASEMMTYLKGALSRQLECSSVPVENIVLHRDGRTFRSEVKGAEKAIESLKSEGALPQTANVTIVEIAKTAQVPLRLFTTTQGTNGTTRVDNPDVGDYFLVNSREGYVCATGRSFPRKGTVQPLHVNINHGCLGIEQCIEDLYALTTLTWTRPEDCTRYPITLKLNDRFLVEEASDYDGALLSLEELDEE